ncbi:MAG: hypothetical protein KH613_02865 [Veillonella sp.]|uniref:hypothetical protein n=1 Tax=Veillonella sp. TaxID=1926307 RepID=UPI001D65867A|nr:hypothetical protein [Veillonella sp.]MBS6186085.1 hypothetical protein [Veillonella sp.]
MTLLVDEIYSFYQNPQNIKDFEEWRKKKYENKNTTTKKSSQINGLGVRRHSKPAGISL